MLNLSIFVLLAGQLVQALCDCGYKSEGKLWTHALLSDFTMISPSNDTASTLENQWIIADWSLGSIVANGKVIDIGRQYLPENVFFANQTLNLKISGYSGQGDVQCAEITTARNDILYGSFRATFKVEHVPGAVAGFFYYHNDTQEIDIEILTKETSSYGVHYTRQPIVKGSQFYHTLPKPWTGFVQHRFDWLHNSSVFYADGKRMRSLRADVEDTPGSIKMNMWSNGNSYWSGGPPTSDALLSIQKVNFYFNVTEDLNNLNTSEFNTACSANPVAVCKIRN